MLHDSNLKINELSFHTMRWRTYANLIVLTITLGTLYGSNRKCGNTQTLIPKEQIKFIPTLAKLQNGCTHHIWRDTKRL